ncbi:uncharacterized protein METZ01_LOCUS319091 [marine metagenome]|uniref:Uncharacterized protein n=1 Tax=marine metagenome TaxID=408172 RepID=A0A382P0F4_9ZZZZ
MGFTLSGVVSNAAVSSYLTFSPLLPCSGMFLWHCPSGYPAPPLAGILPRELGLSSGTEKISSGGRPSTSTS